MRCTGAKVAGRQITLPFARSRCGSGMPCSRRYATTCRAEPNSANLAKTRPTVSRTAAIAFVADRQMGAELTTPSCLPKPASEPGTNEVELDLAHGALKPEQQAVVEDAGVVEPVGVTNEGVDQSAQV